MYSRVLVQVVLFLRQAGPLLYERAYIGRWEWRQNHVIAWWNTNKRSEAKRSEAKHKAKQDARLVFTLDLLYTLFSRRQQAHNLDKSRRLILLKYIGLVSIRRGVLSFDFRSTKLALSIYILNILVHYFSQEDGGETVRREQWRGQSLAVRQRVMSAHR
jgi:hypothetical protein